MQTDKLPVWANIMGYLFGVGMLFIGARFLLMSEVAERGFGLSTTSQTTLFITLKASATSFRGQSYSPLHSLTGASHWP
jgi:hypothetical protein